MWPSKPRWLLGALLLLPLLVGCDDGGTCPAFVDPADGRYSSTGGRFDRGPVDYRGAGAAKELTIDQQNLTVTVSYLDQGRRVVERYRIRSSRLPTADTASDAATD